MSDLLAQLVSYPDQSDGRPVTSLHHRIWSPVKTHTVLLKVKSEGKAYRRGCVLALCAFKSKVRGQSSQRGLCVGIERTFLFLACIAVEDRRGSQEVCTFQSHLAFSSDQFENQKDKHEN